MLVRPTFARACAALAALILTSVAAPAETFPDRPVRLVLAFGSGGTIDTLARILGDKLGGLWNQAVIVDNRPGGSGNIGAAMAAHSAPDGYTIHLGAQSLATNVTLVPAANLDPVRDFEPVVFIGYAQDVLMVPKDSPILTVADLIAAAKAKPGALNYASTGIGSSGHLATILFSQMTGISAEHVPYTALGAATTDLMSGRLSFWMATLGGHLGNVKGGAVRALAVSGSERAKEVPNVPTFKELGIPLVEPSTWFGIFVPKGTPKEIVAKLNKDINQVLATPDMQARLSSLGFSLVGGAPDVLTKHLASEITKWASVAKSSGFEAK